MAGCYHKEAAKTAHKREVLPDFKLFLVDSSTYFNTASLPNGKPVVFFYFGPGCPYSRAQMQGIIDDMEKFKDLQFVIFTTAPFNEMKWFYKNYKLDKYKNIITGLDYTNFFVNYFKTDGVPYLAIYGRDKRLNDAFDGQMPVSQIKTVAEE
jgi:thiol-disulfide isomerase/thioredoxin